MGVSIQSLNLSEDVFLFSCRQALVARTLKDGTFSSHKRYEPFLVRQFIRPKTPSLEEFIAHVQAILGHHGQVWRELREQWSIDLETIAHFSHAFAVITADLRELTQVFLGAGIPLLPREEMEYSDEYPSFQSILSAYSELLARVQSGEPGTEDLDLQAPFKSQPERAVQFSAEWWDIVASGIHGALPVHAEALLTFLVWQYAPLDVSAPPDFNIRPPVGAAFARFLRSYGEGVGGGRAGATFGGGTRGFGAGRGHNRSPGVSNQQSGVDSGQAREHNSSPARDNRADARSSTGPRKGHSGPADGRGHPSAPGRRERHPREARGGSFGRGGGAAATSPEETANCLKAVDQAVERLGKASDLREVLLDPVNSYLRHVQHERAVELGFGSQSRGEGRERAVVVIRKEDV